MASYPLVLAAGVVAIAFAVVVVLDLAGERRDEVAVSPSASPTVAFTNTPGPDQAQPPVPPSHVDGPLELAAAVPVAPTLPALDGLLGGSPEIVRAWYVSKLKGHVILSRCRGAAS